MDFSVRVASIVVIGFIIPTGMIQSAYSTEVASISVDAGVIQTHTFNLDKGAKFKGSLSITGGTGNDIDFWVTDPNGNEIISERRVQRGDSFEFTASQSGAYTLHFDNSFSLISSKLVRLSYDIENPIIPNVGGGGCLIATAAFGSELAPHVQFLRNFRDDKIMSTFAGSSFMNVFNAWYYSFSPYVADYEREQPWLQQLVKASIYPLIGILRISEEAYSSLEGESGVVVAGLIASTMIGAIYFWPFALFIKQVRVMRFNWKLAVCTVAAVAVGLVCSIIAADQIALMITTSLFVLNLVAISGILSGKALIIIIDRIIRTSSIVT